MDTRSKIVEGGAPWPDFPRPLAVATGYFDVLHAGHARELWEARRQSGAATLLAIVLPRAGELLPLRARAELVAALRAVDFVACGGPADPRDLAPDFLLRLEESDERRSRELRARVLSRR